MLARVGTIIGAYLAASAAAGLALALGTWAITVLGSPQGHGEAPVQFIPQVAIVFTPFISVFALLPALPAIIYAERTGRRSIWFYAATAIAANIVAFGALALFAGYADLMGRSGRASSAGLVAAGRNALLVYVLPGLSGGLAYWAIAGRTAGEWRSPSNGSDAART